MNPDTAGTINYLHTEKKYPFLKRKIYILTENEFSDAEVTKISITYQTNFTPKRTKSNFSASSPTNSETPFHL